MTVSRTYHSPLRAQQMGQTRELLLDRAVAIMAERSAMEVTVAEAASAASVSVRTAYRYFPTQDALFQALHAHLSTQWSAPGYPERLDELVGFMRSLYTAFDGSEHLLRATLTAPWAREERARRKAQQMKLLTKAIAAEAPALPAAERARAGSAIHALLGAEAFLDLRGAWGLSLDEAIDSTAWGLDAMISKLRRDAKAHAKKKGSSSC